MCGCVTKKGFGTKVVTFCPLIMFDLVEGFLGIIETSLFSSRVYAEKGTEKGIVFFTGKEL